MKLTHSPERCLREQKQRLEWRVIITALGCSSSLKIGICVTPHTSFQFSSHGWPKYNRRKALVIHIARRCKTAYCLYLGKRLFFLFFLHVCLPSKHESITIEHLILIVLHQSCSCAWMVWKDGVSNCRQRSPLYWSIILHCLCLSSQSLNPL